ncbi:MAG: alpha-glucan family phosphorylase [Planctomycetes bacterium]|nr:alpha-glucan family phosphorylase [Planctomycetota bacterium]
MGPVNRQLFNLAVRAPKAPGSPAADEPADAVSRLHELAFNLFWNWHPHVLELFRDLDPAGWRETNHNPIAVLKRFTPERLAERVSEISAENRVSYHYHRLQDYLRSERTWCSEQAGVLRMVPIAYFSAEFGLHESLPLYSGGLGVLAGDYLKSASDLGLPLVGVGLFYANGYFRQRLDESGWQREEYGTTDLSTLPLKRRLAADGTPLMIQLPCGGATLHAGVWIACVGRTVLLLLDTDVPPNPPHLRDLTARLYGGDEVTRIRQEALLGIGGLRALRALGVRPMVMHLNEGHSAFAILERVRERVEEDGLGFADALRETALQTVFTTHTSVDAGHDRFSQDLLERELGWLRAALRVDSGTLMALGRTNPSDAGEPFCMTVLALKGASQRNGVSDLHGHVARRMWRRVWPGRDEEDVPIRHITNGVHVRSWLCLSMNRIYDRYLGSDWPSRQSRPDTWRAIASVEDAELWENHSVLRRYLVEFVRQRTGDPSNLLPGALTIGFARRFATYKRATLFLADMDRLARLVADARRPVQFVFAGKAHPRDDGGKELIRQVVQASRDPRLKGRFVFLEDYDINVARIMVQGVDVWVNTPLRPLEACGTSGQKVVLNGGLNLSVLDGWWAEAFDGHNGFAIGTGLTHADPQVQWQRDTASLIETIEQEIVPLFFDRDANGLPRRWVAWMKHSIMSLAWRYNADRMVTDYVNLCYLPASGGLSSA